MALGKLVLLLVVLGSVPSSRAETLEARRHTYELEQEDEKRQVSRTLLSSASSPDSANGKFLPRYEWGKHYHVLLEDGYQKGICFERGSTSCVEYSFFSSGPLLAFVANRDATAEALKGAEEVVYVAGSECTGANCTNIKVTVSDKLSYCLVILNRENAIPEFRSPANRIVSINFEVNGCPSTFWRIFFVIIVIVITISIIACCVGACMHLQKTKNLRRQAIGSRSSVDPNHIQMGRREHGRSDPAPLPSAPPHKIQFLEAKI